MSEFLTKKQLLSSGRSLFSRKPKHFFVEIYRSGEFWGKGIAFIGRSRKTMIVYQAITNGVGISRTFEFEEMVSDTKFPVFSMKRDDDVMEFKKDRSPLELNQYSYHD